MDNHLGALWCWLRVLKKDEPYSLLHFDDHWDAADWATKDEDLLALDGVSLDAFTAVRYQNRQEPLIQWANYMTPMLRLRPNMKRAHLAAWQGDEVFAQSPFKTDKRV